MTESQPLLLDDLPVVETFVTWSKKEAEDMARSAITMAAMKEAWLLGTLRGRTLDEVVAAWHRANGVQP